MDKYQSRMMKGVAILLMIFLHLFNQDSNVEGLKNFIFIDGMPLVRLLSKAANPVAFFLILGGYGLYRVYEKGDKNRWSRLIKLMIHYWVILVIFVSIGHFVKPEVYPGSLSSILENFSGYRTTYNGEMWFLLPYIILSAAAPLIFGFFSRFRAVVVVAATLLIFLCTSYCISRYGVLFLYDNSWAYTSLLVFHLLFCFSLGAMAARSRFFERLNCVIGKMQYINIIAWGGLIVFVTINFVFKYNFFYAFGVITCLLHVKLPKWVKALLCKLGDNSMNMWMIHTWFCYYLCHNFVYALSYPLVIFVVVTALSYLCSLIVNALTRPLEAAVMPRREVLERPVL